MRFTRDGGDVRQLVLDRLRSTPVDGAVEEDPVDASEPDQRLRPEPATARRGGWRSVPVLPVVAAILVVALAVVVVLTVRHDRAAAAGEAAVTEVEPHLEQLLSYTPTTVLTDLESEAAWLTGDFARDYEDLVTGTVAPAATAAGVETTASVTASGVDSASSDRVVMLMFVNVSTVSTEAPEPQVSGSRLRVTALQVDGEWKISEIRPL